MMPAMAFPLDALRRLDARAVVDILIIAVVVYYALRLLKGTRAAQMVVTLLLVAAAFYGARWARLEMVEWLLNTLLPYFVIALIVLFQPEIRRALASAGRNPFWERLGGSARSGALDDVVMAAAHFAQTKTGALIVLERDVGLKIYIESGIPLDAALSYDLLLAIFHHASPLHDGAVILHGEKVAAAACFLPLSLNPMLSTQLGTRHRAAIGVTEESDAVAVVVSEQTGAITLASGGAIESNLTAEQLAERLAAVYGSRRSGTLLPGAARSEAAGR